MNNTEKYKSLSQELEMGNLLEIGNQPEKDISKILNQLERIKKTKEFIVKLDKDLETVIVDEDKVKSLLYKEMLLLAEESVKRTRMGTNLSATALAMANLANVIIKIH